MFSLHLKGSQTFQEYLLFTLIAGELPDMLTEDSNFLCEHDAPPKERIRRLWEEKFYLSKMIHSCSSIQ